MTDEVEMVKIASRELYKENLIDAGNRAAKLSGMIHASYEYISTHFDDLEMKTALQMLFGSIDQLNKMEGTGAFAGSEFLLKFQEMLHAIKNDKVIQPTLIYEADEIGEANEITTNDPVDNSEILYQNGENIPNNEPTESVNKIPPNR